MRMVDENQDTIHAIILISIAVICNAKVSLSFHWWMTVIDKEPELETHALPNIALQWFPCDCTCPRNNFD